MNRVAIFSTFSLLLIGCTTHAPTTPHPVTAATAEQKAALLDRVKSLAGTWEMTDEKGQSQTATVFAVLRLDRRFAKSCFPAAAKR